MFSRVLTAVAFTGLLTAAVQPVGANHGWGHHHHGYRGPAFGLAVVAPPPVIVAPAYAYPPAYVAQPIPVPPPMPVPPPVIVPAPAPVYAPTYSYGIMGGPRGVGFGYSSPGFGVYMGR